MRHRLRRDEPVRIGVPAAMQIDRAARIDDIPVRGHLAVLHHRARPVDSGHHLGRRLRPAEGAHAHKEAVVQHRAAKRRMKHVVGEGEFPGEPPLRGVGEVVIAHDESAGIRHRRKLVHPAAVYLLLLLIEAVDQIAGLDVSRHMLIDRKRGIRQLRGKPGVDRRRVEVAVDDRRQEFVWSAAGINLRRAIAGRFQPIGAREQPEHIVEAAVLFEDNDDMPDLGELCIRRLRAHLISAAQKAQDKRRNGRAVAKLHQGSPRPRALRGLYTAAVTMS